MKKKSTNNFPSQPSSHNNIPPQCGGGDYLFLYWDEGLDEEFRDLVLFNSIQDTHRPEDENICKVTKTKNTIT